MSSLDTDVLTVGDQLQQLQLQFTITNQLQQQPITVESNFLRKDLLS